MSNLIARSSVATFIVAAAGLSQASPTSLFLMPIADVLKHREAFAYVGLYGYEHNVDPAYSFFNAATIGLFNRVEVGYDNDFRGFTSMNVKAQLFETPKWAPNMAMSVGAMNWRGDKADLYAVGRYDGKGYRLHAGWWRTMDSDRAMVGTDFPVPGGFTGALEYLSGRGGSTWGSLFYSIPQIKGLGVQIAVGFPSTHSEGIQHSALLYYSFKV